MDFITSTIPATTIIPNGSDPFHNWVTSTMHCFVFLNLTAGTDNLLSNGVLSGVPVLDSITLMIDRYGLASYYVNIFRLFEDSVER
jgi:hypothetical protein